VKLENHLFAAPPNCSVNELQLFGMSEARPLPRRPRSDNAVKERDQLNIESPYLNSLFRDSSSNSPASYRKTRSWVSGQS
jgi:hypothetical protein